MKFKKIISFYFYIKNYILLVSSDEFGKKYLLSLR